MSTFILPRESCEEILDYDVIISTSENGTEQRRLRHENKVLGFNITSPVLSKSGLEAYRDQLINNYGAYEAFNFLSPFDDETYLVRFEPGSFRTTYRAGVFQASFSLKKVEA